MTVVYILISTFIISLISLLGGLLIYFKKDLAEAFSLHLLSLAAGVLLATAILDLLPEAIEASAGSESVYLLIITGILLFFFAERYLLWFHHHDEPHGLKPTRYLILFGDGIHNLIDGLAIGASFSVSFQLGIVTSLAVAGHEIPQELADLAILIKGGLKLKKALLFNFISSLSAIIGGLAAFMFSASSTATVPFFLSFTAGMFIYISASDLIPELHQRFLRDTRWHQAGLFLAGIVIVWVLTKI